MVFMLLFFYTLCISLIIPNNLAILVKQLTNTLFYSTAIGHCFTSLQIRQRDWIKILKSPFNLCILHKLSHLRGIISFVNEPQGAILSLHILNNFFDDKTLARFDLIIRIANRVTPYCQCLCNSQRRFSSILRCYRIPNFLSDKKSIRSIITFPWIARDDFLLFFLKWENVLCLNTDNRNLTQWVYFWLRFQRQSNLPLSLVYT